MVNIKQPHWNSPQTCDAGKKITKRLGLMIILDDKAVLEDLVVAAINDAKKKIDTAHAVVIATPEYNRSIPGVLKNAIDWVSRPYGKNSFEKKPVYIMGATVGHIGTALAHYHLTQILLHLDAIITGQPEIFVGNAGEKINSKGIVTDEYTKKMIASIVKKLEL
jgi:chromate reductase